MKGTASSCRWSFETACLSCSRMACAITLTSSEGSSSSCTYCSANSCFMYIIYIHVCIYVCMYVPMNVYTYVCTCVVDHYVGLFVCLCAHYIHVLLRTFLFARGRGRGRGREHTHTTAGHTYVYIYIHTTSGHTYVCMYIYIRPQDTHTYAYTYIRPQGTHTYIHTYDLRVVATLLQTMYADVTVCMMM